MINMQSAFCLTLINV